MRGSGEAALLPPGMIRAGRWRGAPPRRHTLGWVRRCDRDGPRQIRAPRVQVHHDGLHAGASHCELGPAHERSGCDEGSAPRRAAQSGQSSWISAVPAEPACAAFVAIRLLHMQPAEIVPDSLCRSRRSYRGTPRHRRHAWGRSWALSACIPQATSRGVLFVPERPRRARSDLAARDSPHPLLCVGHHVARTWRGMFGLPNPSQVWHVWQSTPPRCSTSL